MSTWSYYPILVCALCRGVKLKILVTLNVTFRQGNKTHDIGSSINRMLTKSTSL